MRKILPIILLTVFILAACSSQPAVPTQPATPASQVGDPPATDLPTPSPVPAGATDTAAPEPTMTELTGGNASPGDGPTVFKIVPGESQIQYEVGEVFINEANRFNVAVGVTPQLEGEITVNRAVPKNSSLGTITADISQFKSDSGRRDNAIRGRYLESSRYPMVTFVPTQIDGLPDSYQEGQDIPIQISGDLTIREVTKPVSFDAVVRLDGDQLSGQAATTILMSDFGFGPIDIAGILKTEDEVKITLTLVARS